VDLVNTIIRRTKLMPFLGLKWSPATVTLRMVKAKTINRDILKVNFLDGAEKDIKKDIEKLRKKNKPTTYEYFEKRIFKDKEYNKLYEELGITEQLRAMIKREIK
jgi:hypothetical protein